MPEEEFVDRRVNVNDMIDNETDSELEYQDPLDHYEIQNNQIIIKSKSHLNKKKNLEFNS